MNPRDISEKTFEKTLGFGYRVDDVDEFLKEAASSLRDALDQNGDLEKKLEVLADKLTEYRNDEESLRTAILSCQKLGDSVIRESKTKAEIVMRDATIKAEAMIENAKRQIDRERDSLERLQREVASFKNRLLSLYRQHLEMVSSLPGDVDESNLSPKNKRTDSAAPKNSPPPAAQDSKQESDAEARAEPRPEARAEPRPEARAEPRPEPRAEPRSDARPESESRAQSKPEAARQSQHATRSAFEQGSTEQFSTEEDLDSVETPASEQGRDPRARSYFGGTSKGSAPSSRRIEPLSDEAYDLPSDESSGDTLELPAIRQEEQPSKLKLGSAKTIFQSMMDDDDDEDDEGEEFSFLKQGDAQAQKPKEKDMRFGEGFRIKRDSGFPNFSKRK